MPEAITLAVGDVLALRRLLWEVGRLAETRHDLKVEALHWAAVLESVAGLPPWPTAGQGQRDVVDFYEGVVAALSEQVESLRERPSEPS